MAIEKTNYSFPSWYVLSCMLHRNDDDGIIYGSIASKPGGSELASIPLLEIIILREDICFCLDQFGSLTLC